MSPILWPFPAMRKRNIISSIVAATSESPPKIRKIMSASFHLAWPLHSWGQAVVFLKDGAELVVGERADAMIFNAGHGFGGDHGIDDCFFSGLHSGAKNGIELVVGQHFQVDHMVGGGSAGIGSGERDKNVAGAVARNAAGAAESERNAPCESLELMRDERGVRGNHDDDRAVIVVEKCGAGVRIIRGNFPANGNAGNAQIISRTVIALHQDSNRVAAFFF